MTIREAIETTDKFASRVEAELGDSTLRAALNVLCEVADRYEPLRLRGDILIASDIIAEELPATIDGRKGNSPAHNRMHELYEKEKFTNNFSHAAHLARREWIRELLTKHLVGEP